LIFGGEREIESDFRWEGGGSEERSFGERREMGDALDKGVKRIRLGVLGRNEP